MIDEQHSPQPPASELGSALERCRRLFAASLAVVNENDTMDSVRQAWDVYYFGPFAAFDALVKRQIESGVTVVGRAVPLSTTHHNVHRLLEVLERGGAAGPLGSVSAGERVQDLLVSLRNLDGFLEERCAALATAGRNVSSVPLN